MKQMLGSSYGFKLVKTLLLTFLCIVTTMFEVQNDWNIFGKILVFVFKLMMFQKLDKCCSLLFHLDELQLFSQGLIEAFQKLSTLFDFTSPKNIHHSSYTEYQFPCHDVHEVIHCVHLLDLIRHSGPSVRHILSLYLPCVV